MALFALQSQVFRLAGSGASISDTSITLVMMKGIEGNAITMAQLGSKAFATIEPGSGDKEEQISFTGITQNPNGTATLTGVKSVSFYTPYTETNGLNKSHSGGVALTLSNTSGFYNALFNSINKFNITCATTTNVDIATELENGDVVDGYTLATGDTVLVKNQTTQSENGVYIVNTSGAATRAGFFNDDLSIKGAILMVAKGTANQGTIWRNTNTTSITVGVTNITFDDYVKTVDNVGTGEGEIFRDKVGGTGNLKTIKQSGKITVTNNADDITIDTTAEINTASNVGTGEGTIFKQKTVEDLELKTIKAGTNITITNNADDITIASTDTGEVNTASNVGAGSGIFKQKTGVDLELKSLVAGPGVSLADNADDVTITFSPATAKATGAEIDTGTDDTKYVTSKSIADSKLSFTDGVETLTNKTIGDTLNVRKDVIDGDGGIIQINNNANSGTIARKGIKFGDNYNNNGAEFIVENAIGDWYYPTIKIRTRYGSGENTLLDRLVFNPTRTSYLYDNNFTAPLNAPQGFLINGKIVRTVSSGNMTVAIKTLAGNDPSATDPVYVRIGNTIRSITSALSITAAAGANWWNAGSAELATKEIDYFTFLAWDSTLSKVGLCISRYPAGRIFSDFSGTGTNEKSLGQSSNINLISTDEVELIGRFNATLSAGAGYTWSIPTTDIIINRWENSSEFHTWNLTLSGGITTPTFNINNNRYKIVGNRCIGSIVLCNTLGGTAGSGGGDLVLKLPFSAKSSNYLNDGMGYYSNNAVSIPVSLTYRADIGTDCFVLNNVGRNTIPSSIFDSVDRGIYINFDYEI
jgi:hypothetical protein